MFVDATALPPGPVQFMVKFHPGLAYVGVTDGLPLGSASGPEKTEGSPLFPAVQLVAPVLDHPKAVDWPSVIVEGEGCEVMVTVVGAITFTLPVVAAAVPPGPVQVTVKFHPGLAYVGVTA